MNPTLDHCCPLCGGAELTLIHQTDHGRPRSFWQCARCDLVSVPPSSIPDEDFARHHYQQHENTLECEGYVAMFEKALDTFEAHTNGVKALLDYGCGYEPVLKVLAERRGYACQAYDLLFFPDLPEGPFDAVISTEVFEHFTDVAKELDTIQSRLNPGGYLAVMTRLNTAKVDFPTWWYWRDETHVAFFSPTTMQWIAKNRDWKLIHCDDYGFTIFQV